VGSLLGQGGRRGEVTVVIGRWGERRKGGSNGTDFLVFFLDASGQRSTEVKMLLK